MDATVEAIAKDGDLYDLTGEQGVKLNRMRNYMPNNGETTEDSREVATVASTAGDAEMPTTAGDRPTASRPWLPALPPGVIPTLARIRAARRAQLRATAV